MAMDKLISAVGGGIGAALTSDPTDTSNAAKRQAAVSAAETDVEVEDIEAQGQQDRATGGVTPPTPTGQMVPYSQADAAGNPNFAMASGMSSAEIVDGIRTGEPVALEQFYITQDDMGRSIVKFRDDSGQEQQWVVSAATALGMMDTRRENRHKMAEFNAQQLELQQAREENQGAFERGITMLDDGTNPMLGAVLKDMYNKDPIGTLTKMYDLQYLEAKDEDAAAAQKFQIVNGAMFEQSNQRHSQTTTHWTNHFGQQLEQYTRELEGNPNNPQLARALQQLQGVHNVFQQGMGYKPYAGMDMSLSPAQSQQSPFQAEEMYKAWLSMLQIGIPVAGAGDHIYRVNNPQDPDAWSKEGENIVLHLQWLANSLGWQAPMGLEDYMAIQKAFAQVYNNPNALNVLGGSQQPQLQQLPPGMTQLQPQQVQPQQVQPQQAPQQAPQQPPFKSKIGTGTSEAAPFGDPIDLQLASDIKALTAARIAAGKEQELSALAKEKIKNEIQKGYHEIDKLVKEIEQIAKDNISGALEIVAGVLAEMPPTEKEEKDAAGNVIPSTRDVLEATIERLAKKIEPST